jgi:hypothetical protein
MASKKLTAEFIALRTKSDRLEQIKNLNLWGNELEDISIIRNMPLLEVVSLSVNRITTLKDFSFLKNLKELYLRKNSIRDINEVAHLSKCTNLRTLWLSENPVAETKNYRLHVIAMVPQLTKLDDNVVSSDERQLAQSHQLEQQEDSFGEDYGHKEEQVEINYEQPQVNNYEIKKNEEIYSNNEKKKKITDKFQHVKHNNEGINSNNNYLYQQQENINNFEKANIVEQPVKKESYQKPIKRTYTANNDGEYSRRQGGENYPNVNANVVKRNSVNDRESPIMGNKLKEQDQIKMDKEHFSNLNKFERESSPTPRLRQNENKSSNILNCVLMLLNELNENDLEYVKGEIDKKLSKY